MQKSLVTEFRVGIFVTAGVFLAMMIIFMLGSESRFFHRQYTIYASFEDISGLRAGAPVQLAGVKVGHVDGIKVPKDLEEKKVTVVMRINRKYMKRIRADSTATIETQGLLGDKFIYVTMGSETEPIIPNKGVIQSKVAKSLFALSEKAGNIMDNISDASKAIKNMLEQVEKGEGLMHALIYDPKGEQIVRDLAGAMRAVKDVVQQADEEGTAGILVNVRKASADLRSILASVRRGEGTLGKLVTDPTLYNDMRALFGRANRNVLLRSVVRSTIEENERQMLK
jgi:phospholipid/cholesterol/gamma-HCH transport system substrate-binding protein